MSAKRPRQPTIDVHEAVEMMDTSDDEMDIDIDYPVSDLESVHSDQEVAEENQNNDNAPSSSDESNNNNNNNNNNNDASQGPARPRAAPRRRNNADPAPPHPLSQWNKEYKNTSDADGMPVFDNSFSGPVLYPTGLNHESTALDFLNLFLGGYSFELLYRYLTAY